MTQDTGFGPLVEATWLLEHLDDPDLAIFDARNVLNEPSLGREQYLAGHIPGAVHLDLKRDLSDPDGFGGGRNPLPDAQAFADKLASYGVGPSTRIVIYDHGDHMSTRAWWLMRYVGLSRIAILNGGIHAWTAINGPLRSGTDDERNALANPAPAWRATPRHDWVRTLDDVKRIVDAGDDRVALIDARSAERYRGDHEPYDARPGHIPGALNKPSGSFFDADRRWLDRERLAAMLRDVADKDEIVLYCGSGVSACAGIFALHLIGKDHIKLYPGSWSQWSSRDDLPAATGDQP